MVSAITIEESNTCNGASVARRTRLSLKGTTVFTILAILGIASVAGIAGSIVVSSRDGYRRQPKQTFARTV
jgi:hypothetical protein